VRAPDSKLYHQSPTAAEITNRCVCVSRYFLVDADGKVMLTQEGMFRSNCMDCLDRTNVIQSMLAQRSLQLQLRVRPQEVDRIIGTVARLDLCVFSFLVASH